MNKAFDNIAQQRLTDLIRRIDAPLGKLLDTLLEAYDEAIQSIILSSKQTYES